MVLWLSGRNIQAYKALGQHAKMLVSKIQMHASTPVQADFLKERLKDTMHHIKMVHGEMFPSNQDWRPIKDDPARLDTLLSQYEDEAVRMMLRSMVHFPLPTGNFSTIVGMGAAKSKLRQYVGQLTTGSFFNQGSHEKGLLVFGGTGKDNGHSDYRAHSK